MLVALALALALGGPVSTETCAPASRAAGLCSTTARLNDGRVDISAERRSDQRGGSNKRAESRHSAAEDQPAPECDNVLGRCGTYEVVLLRATMTDIASFAPSVSPATAEPAGVGIAGLPLNLVASTAMHTRSGELFDLPVTVRFRPVSYTFDHGDGTHHTTDTGGHTWTQLGLPQFTPTATSHTYRQPGTYTVRTTIHLTADIDYGNGWNPVEGLLAVPAGNTTVHIFQAHTALVEHTCLENPTGTGC